MYSEVFSVSCDNSSGISKGTENYHSFFHSNSLLYELTNTVTKADIDFDSTRCREELLMIKEGIREKDVWTFRRKCSDPLIISKQITKTTDRNMSAKFEGEHLLALVFQCFHYELTV